MSQNAATQQQNGKSISSNLESIQGFIILLTHYDGYDGTFRPFYISFFFLFFMRKVYITRHTRHISYKEIQSAYSLGNKANENSADTASLPLT